MEGSLITKKVIAYSLKKLMQETPFQKITIRQIMSEAEIRRQTFYDHFQDKYELLAWIYSQEISENIQDFLDYEHWTKVVRRILEYFQANQTFYVNALSVSEQNSFDKYFFKHTKELLRTIVGDILAEHQFFITEEKIDFVCMFYSHAFVGLTKDWLLSGCEGSVKTLSHDIGLMLEDSIIANLEKFSL